MSLLTIQSSTDLSGIEIGQGKRFVKRGVARFNQQVADAEVFAKCRSDGDVLGPQRAGGMDKADVLVPLTTGQHVELKPVGGDDVGQRNEVGLDRLDHVSRHVGAANITTDRVNQYLELLACLADALDERRRYLETILVNIGTGVISTDTDDRIRTVNSAAARILGISQSTLWRKLKELE